MRKLVDRQKDRWKDIQKDRQKDNRPYFIGPFQPRLGLQKNDLQGLFPWHESSSSPLCLEHMWKRATKTTDHSQHVFCFLCLSSFLKSKPEDPIFSLTCNKQFSINNVSYSNLTYNMINILMLSCKRCNTKYSRITESNLYWIHEKEYFLSTAEQSQSMSITDIFISLTNAKYHDWLKMLHFMSLEQKCWCYLHLTS